MPTTQPSLTLRNAAPVASVRPATRPRRILVAPPRVAMSSGAGPSIRGLAGIVHAEHQPTKAACDGLIALNGPGYTLGASARTCAPGCGKYCSAKIGRHELPEVW